MIRYDLICADGHEFDGWFKSSDDFDAQRKRRLIACPVCQSPKVSKSLMSPSVTTGRQKEKVAVATMESGRQEFLAQVKALRDKMTEGAEDVGERFPEEARKIHYGESDPKGIYGQANVEEVKELLDEGIAVAPIPALPDDAN